MKLTTNNIASIAHEANRAYAATIGDYSHLPWDETPPEIRESTVRGVLFVLAHRDVSPRGLHAAWVDDKLASGWTYGLKKDLEAKTHPNLVMYHQLPDHEKLKDTLFRAVVLALTEELP